jgi:hypothetical protein
MHAIDVLFVLALAAAPVDVGAPERPPDELIELLQNVDLLDDYGDLFDVEADGEAAPEAAPEGAAKPDGAAGVQEGRDGRP